MTSSAPRRILVVDDDEDYRILLARFLAKAFPSTDVHQYDPVQTGPPAPDFDWTDYDVLILDYKLGAEENGLDWLRRYKRDSANFPVTILLTAAGSEELAVRALRHGAHDYLRKQSLDAKVLAGSIADAFNVRARHLKAERSLTLSASKFSKSFFYSQFELAFAEAEKGENRALALARTDGYEALKKSLGLISMDKITRHVANRGLACFRLGDHVPRATLFGEASIAFLVGGYRHGDDLEKVLSAFQDDVRRNPPIVDGAPVPVSASVGAVVIKSRADGIDRLFEDAESAFARAANGQTSGLVIASGQGGRRSSIDTGKRATAFDALAAIRENRILPMFWPLMAISQDSSKLKFSEFFEVELHFVARNGDSIQADAVLARQKDTKVDRLADRWQIRECVGRVLADEGERDAPGFLISMNEASFNDANLEGWIDELVRFHGGGRPLHEICIGISPKILMRATAEVLEFCNRLRGRHGFRFVLDGIGEAALCRACFSRLACDLVVLSAPLVKSIIDKGRGSSESKELLSFDVKRGALSVARGIEDADALHAVISAGVDFARGEFVAPAQEEIGAAEGAPDGAAA